MTTNHLESSLDYPNRKAFARVGENLYRHAPTGRYYAFIKRGGKQFRRSLRTTDRALAKRRLAEEHQRVARLTLSDEATATFAEVAALWYSLTKHTISDSTALRRRQLIKNITPFFNGVTVRNVTHKHCHRWLTERGPQLAAQTFAHELNAMRAVLGYAVEKGLLLNNPALAIKRKPIPKSEILVPTRDQFRQLVDAIRASDGRDDSRHKSKPAADLVELLAYTGCRLGEATAMTWAHVDMERGTIHVHGTKSNSADRVIPMTGEARALLLRLKAELDTDLPGANIISIVDAKTAIGGACRRLGWKNVFTHHDFRHFFATTCIESGVDIPTISRWLGHSDGGVLAMKVYGHLRRDHSFAAAKKVHFGTVNVPANVLPLVQSAAN